MQINSEINDAIEQYLKDRPNAQQNAEHIKYAIRWGLDCQELTQPYFGYQAYVKMGFYVYVTIMYTADEIILEFKHNIHPKNIPESEMVCAKGILSIQIKNHEQI